MCTLLMHLQRQDAFNKSIMWPPKIPNWELNEVLVYEWGEEYYFVYSDDKYAILQVCFLRPTMDLICINKWAVYASASVRIIKSELDPVEKKAGEPQEFGGFLIPVKKNKQTTKCTEKIIEECAPMTGNVQVSSFEPNRPPTVREFDFSAFGLTANLDNSGLLQIESVM